MSRDMRSFRSGWRYSGLLPHQEVVVQLVPVYLDALAKRGQALLRQWHKKLPVLLGRAEGFDGHHPQAATTAVTGATTVD